MSTKAEKKDKKEKKGKKGKKGEAAGAAAGTAVAPSVAGHPRARANVRRAKGWGGLAGFGIAAYVSTKAGVPATDAGLRALGAGIAGYMLAWVCAVTVWRHLVLAELRAAVEGSGPRRVKANGSVPATASAHDPAGSGG